MNWVLAINQDARAIHSSGPRGYPRDLIFKFLKENDRIRIVEYAPVRYYLKYAVKIKYWKPPPFGVTHIYTDGSCFKRRGAWSAVARNWLGDIKYIKRSPLNRISGPEVAEAIGFLNGVKMGRALKVKNFKIYNDCLQLINALKGSTINIGLFGTDPYLQSLIRRIVREIDALKKSGIKVDFDHCGRELNEVANYIAISTRKRQYNEEIAKAIAKDDLTVPRFKVEY